jgi:hypothetical protein
MNIVNVINDKVYIEYIVYKSEELS